MSNMAVEGGTRCGKNLKSFAGAVRKTTHSEESVSLMNRHLNKTKRHEQAPVMNELGERIQAQTRDKPAKRLERNFRKERELKEMKTKRHEQAPVLNKLGEQIQAQAIDKPAKRLERNCRKEIELKEMVNELKATADGLKKKRDFYFRKLQVIEVFCHEMEEQQNDPIIQKILDILYATETVEVEVEANEKEFTKKLEMAVEAIKSTQKLLDQETTKCQEQAAVLNKLEEQIQAQARALEEAKGLEQNLRKELELKEMALKQQEKAMLERENEFTRALEMFLKIRKPTPNNNIA